jgi:sugar-specific transcriptional regulator TrmB
MIQELESLGLDKKEAITYLKLLELGTQVASTLSKQLKMPRTTTLYILENLYLKNMVKKSFEGKTQYFTALVTKFKETKTEEYNSKLNVLEEIIPKLKKIKSTQKTPVKIEFFEGITGCQKAYGKMLKANNTIYEFTSHEDLEKMGKKFMQDIIKTRSKNKQLLMAIAENTQTHQFYNKLNKTQFREIKLFNQENGQIPSLINTFDDQVIIMNLHDSPFAIHITNKHLAESLRTIHKLAWGNLKTN